MTFIFVHREYAVTIQAVNSEMAVCKLAEQMSQTVGYSMSDNPADYWQDIAEGSILMFKSGDKAQNICVPTTE